MLTDFNDFWHAASWRNLTLADCKFARLTWENVTQYLAKYNATESVQNDHPVHGHMLPVVSAIGQWPHPRRSAAVQPTSQQAAAATCPHPG